MGDSSLQQTDTNSPGRRAPGRRSNAVDRHVGAQMRSRRLALGLSQQQLAQMIGVTYQQAQKYELAQDRVSAGRLFQIAQALSVAPAYFYEGLPGVTTEVEASLTLEMARALAKKSGTGGDQQI